MILAASLEFDKRHNTQVPERPTDNEEVPSLIKLLPHLNEKCKEVPLCRNYSVKARAIIHAHLSRLPLNPSTLEKDRQFVIKKCPYLVNEMVSVVNQLIMLAYAGRISGQKLPPIETIENCMKLAPMIIQGLWEFKSPLLQLPHLTEDNLKYFVNKKRYIKSVQQFAKLSSDESRSLLRDLTDQEYENVMRVLGKMPLIDFSIRCEVVDDENSNVVTAGAIVTVTVNLVRRSMKELFGDALAVEKQTIKEDDGEKAVEENGTGEVVAGDQKENVEPKAKKPVWLKQKGHKGKSKSKSSKAKPAVGVMKQAPATNNSKEGTKENQAKPISMKPDGNDSDADESSAESDNENVDEERDRSSEDERKASSPEDDDMEWEK